LASFVLVSVHEAQHGPNSLLVSAAQAGFLPDDLGSVPSVLDVTLENPVQDFVRRERIAIY